MAQKKQTNQQNTPKKVRRSSLTRTLILGITIPLVLILTLVGVVLRSGITHVVEDLKYRDINAQTSKAAAEANVYFSPFFNTAKVLSMNDKVQILLSESVSKGADYDFASSPHYFKALRELQNVISVQGQGLKAIWLAGVTNSQAITSNETVTDSSFVITDRPWFQQVKAAPQGQVILTSAYEDFETGQLIVTAAYGVYKDSELRGVLGMDIELTSLLNTFRSIRIGEEGYLTVYDSDGNVLYHPLE